MPKHFQEMQTMLALLLLWAGAVAAQSLRVSPAALPYSGATIAVSWFDRFGTGNPFGAPLTCAPIGRVCRSRVPTIALQLHCARTTLLSATCPPPIRARCGWLTANISIALFVFGELVACCCVAYIHIHFDWCSGFVLFFE